MANPTPRVALSVPADIKKIYDDTADELGMPTSKLIVQIMMEAAPGVQKMGEAVRAAKEDPETGLRRLSDLLDDARKIADDGQLDIEYQLKKTKNK